MPRSPYQRRTLLSDRQVVKFRYYETQTFNPGVGTTSVNVYSCNGLFDPNITGVGAQPRGFDQLMALYNHYVVTDARISVKWAPVATSSNNYIVGVAIRDTNTTDATPVEYAEDYRVRSGIQMNGGDSLCTTIDYNTGEFFGIRKSQVLAREDLRGGTTNNPDEQAYFHVWCAGANPSEDPGSINAYIVIDYVAQLQEHVLPSQS